MYQITNDYLVISRVFALIPVLPSHFSSPLVSSCSTSSQMAVFLVIWYSQEEASCQYQQPMPLSNSWQVCELVQLRPIPSKRIGSTCSSLSVPFHPCSKRSRLTSFGPFSIARHI